jgi:alkylation response protein AidB-like acyl-CoA dehydrogenase
MDLSLSDSEELLQSTVRSFVQREASTETLTALQASECGFNPEWSGQMAEAGWLGMLVSGEAGGASASTLEAAIICEELGRGPVPGPFLASSVVGALLVGAATETKDRDDFLSAIATGDAVVSPILPGLNSMWDGPPVLAAQVPADGGYCLDGTVPFVPYASGATHFLLLKPAPAGDHALDLVVLPAGTTGVEVRLLDGLLAWNYEVSFSQVRVEDATVLRICDRRDVGHALARAYALVSAYQVGGCQAVFDRSLEYSNTRFQFGVPIGSFQRVQDHVIELLNALDAARWTTYEAIWHLDIGRSADPSVHLAKAVASESYLTCTDFAHKIHGGIGVDPQYGLTLFTQMSRSLYSYLGRPRWHKRRMLESLKLSYREERHR